ncbi:MAG: YjgN family protein [Verrucomicrobiota bacterium]
MTPSDPTPELVQTAGAAPDPVSVPEPAESPAPPPSPAPANDGPPTPEVISFIERVPALDAAIAPPVIDPASVSAPVPESPGGPPPEPVSHPILFHGRTEEYFRIWIVNTLLTLLTLGVFFSWAKVRKRRYVRGSTELMGHRFDYRASPIRLLIGHAVVLSLMLGYSLFGVVYPWIRFGVIGIALVLLPWIVVRSLSFNAHNTVYRGLRFRFHRSLSAAVKVYLLEPVLIVLSLGFYYPGWQRSKRAYTVNNHRFGDAYFRFAAPAGRFYFAYFFGGLIIFGAALVGGGIVSIMSMMGTSQLPGVMQMAPFFVLYAFGFFLSKQYVFARLFNHVWNHTRLDEHRFQASLQTGRWLGLQLTNLGAILVTAGMLYPWAMIRSQRYIASCLVFIPAGPVDTIQKLGGSTGSATGDMAAEFIGIDFGL